MKRNLLFALWTICILIYASGCSGSVSQTDYDRLLEENQRLSMELEEERSTVDAKVTGSFVAAVRHLMPDYVLDDALRIAIMTEFQSGPYMLWLPEEIIAQLKIGETYLFEIEDTPIGEIPQKEFKKGGYYYPGQHLHPLFTIKTVRTPEEGEWGVSSPHLIYEENDL